jgi:hypothetical protein
MSNNAYGTFGDYCCLFVWIVAASGKVQLSTSPVLEVQKRKKFDEEEASSVRMRSRSGDGERREFFHVIVRRYGLSPRRIH